MRFVLITGALMLLLIAAMTGCTQERPTDVSGISNCMDCHGDKDMLIANLDEEGKSGRAEGRGDG